VFAIRRPRILAAVTSSERLDNFTWSSSASRMRILKHRPPRTAKILVVGLSGLPVAYLLIDRRSLYRRSMVVWSDRASTELDHCYCKQDPKPRCLPQVFD
jgi:hypothetical protein